MENQFFLNAGVPTWQSLSSEQTQDCFYNQTREKSTDHNRLQFDSALSSMVSSPSPAASNSNMSNDNFVISELIGKLGSIGGGATDTSGEISPHNSQAAFAVAASSSYINGANSTNTSCYSTPMSSPPKVTGMSHVAEFSADPGFAERASKFSCFGSTTSFNAAERSTPVTENAKLPRVLGSQNADLLEVTNSQGESTISEQTRKPYASSRKRKASSSSSKGEGAKDISTPPMGAGGSEESNAKRSKRREGEGNENGSVKAEEESKEGTSDEKPAEPPKDYIHVRARRGQATDSHSLAERVRREKISERMKLLQDLVPGCNKVTGKALMLDEIINYVQSLQRQVEFLSMKLSSVNTRMDFSIESLISKDIFQSNNCLAHPIFQLDSSSPSYSGQHPIPQQNSAIHNNIPNGTVTHHGSVDPLDTGLGMQLPPLNAFNNNNESGSQYPMTFSEDDLHAIVQMGFGQTANSKTPLQSQSFSGSNQVPL